jgi:hypothetical protein
MGGTNTREVSHVPWTQKIETVPDEQVMKKVKSKKVDGSDLTGNLLAFVEHLTCCYGNERMVNKRLALKMRNELYVRAQIRADRQLIIISMQNSSLEGVKDVPLAFASTLPSSFAHYYWVYYANCLQRDLMLSTALAALVSALTYSPTARIR